MPDLENIRVSDKDFKALKKGDEFRDGVVVTKYALNNDVYVQIEKKKNRKRTDAVTPFIMRQPGNIWHVIGSDGRVYSVERTEAAAQATLRRLKGQRGDSMEDRADANCPKCEGKGKLSNGDRCLRCMGTGMASSTKSDGAGDLKVWEDRLAKAKTPLEKKALQMTIDQLRRTPAAKGGTSTAGLGALEKKLGVEKRATDPKATAAAIEGIEKAMSKRGDAATTDWRAWGKKTFMTTGDEVGVRQIRTMAKDKGATSAQIEEAVTGWYDGRQYAELVDRRGRPTRGKLKMGRADSDIMEDCSRKMADAVDKVHALEKRMDAAQTIEHAGVTIRVHPDPYYKSNKPKVFIVENGEKGRDMGTVTAAKRYIDLNFRNGKYTGGR